MYEQPDAKIESLLQENAKLRQEIELVQKYKSDFGTRTLENTPKTALGLSIVSDETILILNHLPVGIIIFDAELNTLFVNSMFGKIFTIDINLILGFNLNNLTDKSFLPAFNQCLNGKPGFYEGRYIPTFGEFISHISVQSAPIELRINGKIQKCGIAVFEDISDKRVAEEAQNKTFDVLQTVTNNINAIIYAINPETKRILFINKRGQDIFGLKTRVVCSPDDAPKTVNDNCLRCVLTQKEFETLKPGRVYYKEAFNPHINSWFQYSYSLIDWINDEPALLVTSIDIQTQKNALDKVSAQNEHINKQAEILKEDSKMKDTMFSIIGHDLRGPIGNIKSALDLLVEEFDTLGKAAILEIVNPVRDSAGSAYTLLANLLNWAKTHSGKIGFIPEDIDIEDLISENLSLFKTQCENKRIEITYDNAYEGSISADENMLNTILRNLISNAIKFTPSGGFVVINIEPYKQKAELYMKIEVCDTGIGMSEARINEIFSTQNPKSSYGTNNEKGSGLGIILCKAFVEKHQGFFEVESVLGSGTCFRVILPANTYV